MNQERDALQRDNAGLREQVAHLKAAYERDALAVSNASAVDENALLKRLVAEHALFAQLVEGLNASVVGESFISRERAAQEIAACRLHCLWLVTLFKRMSQPVEQHWTDRHRALLYHALLEEDDSLLVILDMTQSTPNGEPSTYASTLAESTTRVLHMPDVLENHAKDTRKGAFRYAPYSSWSDDAAPERRTISAVRETDSAATDITEWMHLLSISREPQVLSTLSPNVEERGVADVHTFFRSQTAVVPWTRASSTGRGVLSTFGARHAWFFWDQGATMRLVAVCNIRADATTSNDMSLRDMYTPGQGLSQRFLDHVQTTARLAMRPR